MITINKGIKMPTSGKRKNKYPLHIMEVGDSFLYKSDTSMPSVAGARSLIHSVKERLKGRKFDFAATHEGVRIWRIK